MCRRVRSRTGRACRNGTGVGKRRRSGARRRRTARRPERATLLEYDERNVAAAQAAVADADLINVTVVHADAGDLASYLGAVPADLVLLAGVFGNVSDTDVHRTIQALPQLCAPGATVIWTRSRRAPDLTPAIRRWLQEASLFEAVFQH